MTANERKVRERFATAVCFKVRGEGCYKIHPARWQQGTVIGLGETIARAWADAAANLQLNVHA